LLKRSAERSRRGKSEPGRSALSIAPASRTAMPVDGAKIFSKKNNIFPRNNAPAITGR
jgi:hypothetical protein